MNRLDLIANFAKLISTNEDFRDVFDKLQSNLSSPIVNNIANKDIITFSLLAMLLDDNTPQVSLDLNYLRHIISKTLDIPDNSFEITNKIFSDESIYLYGILIELTTKIKQLIPNDSAVFDVFLIAGQSNAVGTGTPKIPWFVDVRDSRVYQVPQTSWSQYKGEIIPADSNLFHYDYVNDSVGFGLTFGIEYTKVYNRNVLLIPCAKGGSGFSTNDWNPGNTIFETTISVTNSILEDRNKILKGILWHQGETDNGLAENYKVPLDNLIREFRNRLICGRDVPFICGTLCPPYIAELLEFNKKINKSIMMTPLRVENTESVIAVGLIGNDDEDKIHFNAVSQRNLGQRYFQKYQKLTTRNARFLPHFSFGLRNGYLDDGSIYKLSRQTGTFVNDTERGRCLQLNPNNETPDYLITNCGNPIEYTKSCWVKLNNVGIHGIFSTNGRPYDILSIQNLRFDGSSTHFGIKFIYEDNNFNNITLEDPDTLPINKWVHVVTSRNRDGRMRIYRNGQLVLEKIDPQVKFDYDNSPLMIGTLGGDNWNSMNGRIQFVKMFDVELSPQQVFELANS